MPSEEIIRKLEVEISKARNTKPMDIYTLELLFAPTGVIQEISIDNGWGTKFLRIAEVVDQSREVENNWISPVFNGKSKDLSHELRE